MSFIVTLLINLYNILRSTHVTQVSPIGYYTHTHNIDVFLNLFNYELVHYY